MKGTDLFLILLLSAVCFTFGVIFENNRFKTEAVEADVAEYHPKTGKWYWLNELADSN